MPASRLNFTIGVPVANLPMALRLRTSDARAIFHKCLCLIAEVLGFIPISCNVFEVDQSAVQPPSIISDVPVTSADASQAR